MQQKPKLSMSVQYASQANNIPTRPKWRRWMQAALEHDVQLTLRIVDEEEGRRLNHDFRGKDYATNVLTFTYDDEFEQPEDMPIYGDIVICAPVVECEANEQNKNLEAHYAHLAIHAALHLQGYDHEEDQEAEIMETRECELMLKLSFPNPY